MLRSLLAVGLLAVACGGDDAEQPTFTTSGGEQCASVEGEWRSCFGLPVTSGIDVLFVVDRSARMGPAQARLAQAMPELVEALGDLPEGMGARVAFTKAEAPVPPCPGVAGPELVLRSCREHLDDFVRDDGTDARASACTDACPLETLASTAGPWIEWGPQGSSVGDVELAAALACAAPQGIAGCDFPAPIGAVERIYEDERAYDRAIVVVIVSDAADCTLAGDGDLIFEPDSNRTFWTDPTATTPMPAICWNADVTCSGAGGSYDACELARKDFLGEIGGSGAVLAAADVALQTNLATDVVGIVGVPVGWQRGDAIPYADASDPAVQLAYGIGPACTASDGSFGLPSPRVQAFVEANPHDPDHPTDLFSICADDWGPTMHAIVALARDLVPTHCIPSCVADVDPSPGLQVACEVALEHVLDGAAVREPLSRCDDGGAVPGEVACWSPRTGEALAPECRDPGFNLEVELRWSGAIPREVSVSASCRTSADAESECPGLP